jgi:hypothetical protein
VDLLVILVSLDHRELLVIEVCKVIGEILDILVQLGLKVLKVIQVILVPSVVLVPQVKLVHLVQLVLKVMQVPQD